jgi:hypothetical protein
VVLAVFGRRIGAPMSWGSVAATPSASPSARLAAS